MADEDYDHLRLRKRGFMYKLTINGKVFIGNGHQYWSREGRSAYQPVDRTKLTRREQKRLDSLSSWGELYSEDIGEKDGLISIADVFDDDGQGGEEIVYELIAIPLVDGGYDIVCEGDRNVLEAEHCDCLDVVSPTEAAKIGCRLAKFDWETGWLRGKRSVVKEFVRRGFHYELMPYIA